MISNGFFGYHQWSFGLSLVEIINYHQRNFMLSPMKIGLLPMKFFIITDGNYRLSLTELWDIIKEISCYCRPNFGLKYQRNFRLLLKEFWIITNRIFDYHQYKL